MASGPTVAALGQIWEEMLRVRQALCREVQALSKPQVAFRPSPEAWSIGEVLDHLARAELSITRVVSRILQQAAGRGLIGEPGSMELPPHQIDLEVYSQSAAAPESVRPLADQSLERLLVRLQESRDRLREVARRAEGRVVGDVTIRHFQLGELNFYQWLALEAAHESRHLQQIRRIRSRPDFPAT
jgi:uncharacterized damage-inducible protein DinB